MLLHRQLYFAIIEKNKEVNMGQNIRTQWYKDAVIYQIYPRSFMDSNGDGIGDIRGIISKLDYIKDLGVNAVWLSPCYKSPNDDNGYDISDYRDIMEEFGTLDDWKEMIDGMHIRGIKLIMDLVVNHTSDEHFWFKESKKSKDNPYRDYYIWRKGRGKNGKKPPNNWTSRFGGTAWKYDETTKEWYLHIWSEKQPDLNWDNPKVRQEVQDIVRYWLDLGVDGFRCDVITYISKTINKDGSLPNGKYRIGIRGDEMFTHGPHIHEYLHELNHKVLSQYDCMTVGEAAGVNIEQGLLYTQEDREELDTVFQFEHVESDMFMQVIPKKFNLPKFKSIMTKWQQGLYQKGWNSIYLENHDQPRSLPRFVGNYGEKRKEAAKMLAMCILLMQGCPYVYQGQEIGMTNYHFKSVDEMRDNLALNIYKMIKVIPFGKAIFLKIMQKRSRDLGRLPMQWSSEENAGFTSGNSWAVINPNYKTINVKEAEEDSNSILAFYKAVIAFRKGNDIVRNGTFVEYNNENKDLFIYERNHQGKRLFVILNFKNKKVQFKLPKGYSYHSAKLQLSNYNIDRTLQDMYLNEYEALCFYVE